MNSLAPLIDYTRVTDDAAILCRRQDFPRALNVLQRRAPDHRRWRLAFHTLARSASSTLIGRPRAWMVSGVRDLVSSAPMDPWLRSELAVDLYGSGDFEVNDVLPEWTARELWSLADREELPMAYLAQVTALPRSIDERIDTARTVRDLRRVAVSHREEARTLQSRLGDAATRDGDLSLEETLLRIQVDAHRDASERWRGLARRLLFATPRG